MKEFEGKKYFFPVKKETSLDDYCGKKNILVISPHPDDDVLAAGGSMAAASEEGKGVFSVYLTDGRRSPKKGPEETDDMMALRRTKEAIAALRAIGATGGFFLKGRREELEKGGERMEGELIKILKLIRPEEVLLPAPYERHPTHQRCSLLSLKSLRLVPGQKIRLLGYSLWGSFWGAEKRVVRDITPFIQKKIQAIRAHRSQIASKNYLQGILGKSHYEAVFWESHEPQKMAFVEIFLTMNELLENPKLTLGDFIRQDVESFIRVFL